VAREAFEWIKNRSINSVLFFLNWFGFFHHFLF
jgi:hypothetical protein